MNDVLKTRSFSLFSEPDKVKNQLIEKKLIDVLPNFEIDMKPILPLAGMALFSVGGFAQQTPNFLIIQCDHLTQRVMGAYGETQGVTPAIDGVAAQGVVFANAYVGCPLSQPSRAALWTGMMPHQTNVRYNTGEKVNKPKSVIRKDFHVQTSRV